MNKKILLNILLFFTFFIHASDKIPAGIFVNTTPIKAKIFIDGADSGLLTPCLLSGINPISRRITIKKDGFKDYNISIKKIENNKLDIYLAPNSFMLYFPDISKYKIGDTEYAGPVYLGLKNGNYNFKTIDDKILITKKSNLRPARIFFGATLGVSLVFTGMTLGLSQYYNYAANSTINDFDRRHYELVSHGFSAGMYASISISSVLAIVLLAVTLADESYKRKVQKEEYSVEKYLPEDKSKEMYESSIDLLSSGDIEKSITVLKTFVSLYPDSDYIPAACYQLGQNYYILDDYDNALRYYEIFITEYPLADYYNNALKNISEIHYLKQDYNNAVKAAEKIILSENSSDYETILSFRAELFLNIFKMSNNDDYFETSEKSYLTLIDNFFTSERVDFYYLKLIELYNMIGDTDKLTILKEKARKIQNPSMRELILRHF